MFPETVLHTDRLVLRPFTAADSQDTQASCADALTQRRLPLPRPYTLDAATAYTASRKTALAAGFRQEGILRNAGFVHDGRVDLVLFSLVADDLRGS
ncbi:hypothetical protein [Streptomyces murinus]|uniref:GNAT family N-acetyltransferase n=1 Tax=Streptomyces murinus TaxID=33900 RepID=UPI003F478396